MMDVVVEIPRKLIFEATEEMLKIPCARKQPVFNLFPEKGWLFPEKGWTVHYTCGTNRGKGSDNGYGVGHLCKENCKLRLLKNS